MNKTRKQQLIYTICMLLLVPYSYGQKITHNLNSLDWKFRRVGDSVWHQATVPGTVYTDLLNNKLIPDPFYGDNEKQVQWVDTCDWEYEAEFNLTADDLKQEHIEIDFKGLDTYAKVYVNDSLVIDAHNMFLEWNRDIKSYINLGKNTLRIYFNPALKHDIAEEKKLPYKLPGEERVFSRKAQYQYGWDFAPRFLGCGIWKDVKLKIINIIDFEDLTYRIDSLTDSIAEISLRSFFFNNEDLRKFYLLIKVNGNLYSSQEIKLFSGIEGVQSKIRIKEPRKWWCNGIGEPYLYNIEVQLLDLDNRQLMSKTLSIGLRSIELIKDSDKIGQSFYFKLNGVRIFIKGANYVPPDVFLTRATKGKYDSLVDMAVAANMNMLRVWGGGVYPDREFYDACDRKGILVWQDFMYACGMYIDSSHYKYYGNAEATSVVNQYGNDPCLALWCGNNEIKEGWNNWDWQKQYKYSKQDSLFLWNNYQAFFETHLAFKVDWNDNAHHTSYIPTSPQIGWGHEEAMRYGDSHYWGVWWGMEPFEIYNKKVPRFMSEYGFQSLPDISTLEKITDTLSLSSLKLKNHQKYPTGFQTIDEYMKRDFKVPAKFEDYVYVSQLLQAEGMQTAIEAHRRAKPNCMGTLYWQFNDCWPGVTWSSIDYYGTPKALYYQAKELYNNVLISVIKENEKYNVYIISDSLQSLKDRLELKLIDFNGKVLADTSVDVTVPASSSVIYATLDKNFLDKIDTTNTVLVCSFMNRKKLFYFAKPKNLKLSKTNVAILDVRLKDNAILISTDVLAKNVYLQMKGATFNDNYFDLLPGETKIIKCTGKKRIDESDLTITTLGDVMSR